MASEMLPLFTNKLIFFISNFNSLIPFSYKCFLDSSLKYCFLKEYISDLVFYLHVTLACLIPLQEYKLC